MDRLENKIALITGIGGQSKLFNNGKAIAVLFSKEGAIVEGSDINILAAERTKQLIKKNGDSCSIKILDVTCESEVKAWVSHCIFKHKKIDILVNNVGQSEPGGPTEIDKNNWDKQIELNLTSAFLTMKHVIPHMVKSKSGSIINVASIAGKRYLGKPQVAYSAAKAGLIQLTKTSALIHAKHQIRMNCVIPGLINTPMVTKIAKKYSTKTIDEYRQLRDSAVPMGFMGSAWDVAHSALFLASDESKYITATEIVVDGGLIAATRGDF